MTDLQTCKNNLKTLGLSYPFSVQEERKAFHQLSRKHNPNFCETSECREENKAKLAQIIEAHSLLKSGKCRKILDEYAFQYANTHKEKWITETIKKVQPSFEFPSNFDLEADNKLLGKLEKQAEIINDMLSS